MVKANHALSNSALYGVVNNISSVEVLQSDLNKLVVWPDYGRWLSMPASVFYLESLAPEIMSLNNYTYTMMGHPITSVTHSFFAQENLATCVVDETHTIKTWTWLMEWNTYQGHEFEKKIPLLYIRRSEATWGLLFMSRYCSRKRVGTVCVLKFRSAY